MVTISHIGAKNFLSLDSLDLDLGALNVLVGPNGAGKTNILKVFQFIGEVARLDLSPAIEAMGDFENLLFRGTGRKDQIVRIHFRGIMSQHASIKAPDEYRLSFWERALKSSDGARTRRALNRNEEIVVKRTAGRGRRITLSGSSLKIENVGERIRQRSPASLRLQNASTGLATIRKLGESYEASGVEAIAQVFEQLRLFEIDVERVRRPGRFTSAPSPALRPDAGNLAGYLFYLSEDHPAVFQRIADDVRFVLPGFRGFEFQRLGGGDEAIRVDIREDKLAGTTPLARASFGTLRSIALFAMLHDPNPPHLTCLEEIDHGLHPHALDLLVDRIRQASMSTQIILATHSPALVNRLFPSELIVVERNPDTGGTRAFRPDHKLIESLQDATGFDLGELWFSGSLGGGL